MLDGGQWEPSAAMRCSWQASLADNPISSLLPPPQKFSLAAQGTWAVLAQRGDGGGASKRTCGHLQGASTFFYSFGDSITES